MQFYEILFNIVTNDLSAYMHQRHAGAYNPRTCINVMQALTVRDLNNELEIESLIRTFLGLKKIQQNSQMWIQASNWSHRKT